MNILSGVQMLTERFAQSPDLVSQPGKGEGIRSSISHPIRRFMFSRHWGEVPQSLQ